MTQPAATTTRTATPADLGIDPAILAQRLALRAATLAPRLHTFLGYYRNPALPLLTYLPGSRSTTFGHRPYRQYQERGLPTRITGFRHTCDGNPVLAGTLDDQRKEVVIENDIAWRLNTLVDFALGQMPVINSTVADPQRRDTLTAVLRDVLDANGGLALLQHLTLLSAIHGVAHLFLRPSDATLARLGRGNIHSTTQTSPDAVGLAAAPGDALQDPGVAGSKTLPSASPAPARVEASLAPGAALRLEIVEAPRVLPILPPGAPPGVPTLTWCAILHDAAPAASTPAAARLGVLGRMARWFTGIVPGPASVADASYDLWTSAGWQRYVDGALVDQGENPLGFVPVLSLVNQRVPGVGQGGAPDLLDGLSEVEPLISLQDELNTRLSDRASRVTMQSFRMYLARGVEDFTTRPIGPGQMWATDNPQATIESFGGDAASPSEDAHIEQIRQALDKISGVPPVAAGLLREKLGNLTSAVALRITLIALLARTEKRRANIGQLLTVLCRRVFEILDAAGIVATTPDERGIEVNWPSAIPENTLEKLQEATIKVNLGVRQAVVLRELGYEPDEMALTSPDAARPSAAPSAASAATAPPPPSASASAL